MNLVGSSIIGVLAGIVTVGTSLTGVLTWVVFAAWASFFAAGGKVEGFKKSIAGNLSGVVWGLIIVQLLGVTKPLGAEVSLFLVLTVIVGAICFAGKIPLLSFIPGAFIGCAIFFGTNFDWQKAVIGIVTGGVMGIISEQLVILSAQMLDKSNQAK